MENQKPISKPLSLPCGSVIPNRLAKSAMTEALSDARNQATDRHVRLYNRWTKGGAGLMLTGNIQVDRRYMERPGNVAIDGEQSDSALAALTAMASAGKSGDNHFWAQLSHAGRQTPAMFGLQNVGPTDYAGGLSEYFGRPRALDSAEIKDIIARFGNAAAVARKVGFTGVQIHAAHGYLFNQFLSPDVNTRSDEWGGSLKNRAKPLLEAVSAARAAVGSNFPISVKMNIADFHKGGFASDEALQVASWLRERSIDLIEISGGTAEEPSMFLGNHRVNPKRGLELKRGVGPKEAYFLEYGRDIREAAGIPVMVTGGFRSSQAMNDAITSGACDMIGLGRPLAINPLAAGGLLSGSIDKLEAFEAELRLTEAEIVPGMDEAAINHINLLGPGLWFQYQVMKMGWGEEPDPELGLLASMTAVQENDAKAVTKLVR